MARDHTGMKLSSINATAAIPPAEFSPQIRAVLSMATVCLLAGEIACGAQTNPPVTTETLSTAAKLSAASLPTATKEKPWVNSLGMRFVPVAGTKVLVSIWETRVQDYAAYAAAQSGVDGSWRDLGFKQEQTHPVANVSWDDAQGFCRWLTEKERAAGVISRDQSYRLPTDTEWSWAVGIGDREEKGTPKEKDERVQNVYPWGIEWPPPNGAGNYEPGLKTDKYETTAPVGSFAANSQGLYDMGGNVWEWCEDFYDGKGGARVLRGASWCIDGSGTLKSSRRGIAPSNYRMYHMGFRVVLASGPASQ